MPSDDLTADRIVFAEQHVEGVNAPCFMVCDGSYKLIVTFGHDARLYDLTTDPMEHNDLHNDPQHLATFTRLRDALSEKFDAQAIEQDIVASIKKRHLLKHAMKANGTRWDYVPNGHRVKRDS